ncbi:Fe2+-dependent dioxygenase [Undibacterium danionis]|uniref:Fe2+-dependent dioxygenase n=1 Tax=Undibacterium danionis TaxID=1812100 RepID=A0ABV6IEV8_9BURK
MLIVIDAVLSKEEVAQCRSHLDSAEWQDGAKTAGSLAQQVKRNLQLDDQAEVAISLGNHILRKLGAHPLFISAALPQKIYPPKFNCYQDGGGYGLHVDSAVMTMPSTNRNAVNHNLRSDLAATLFLCEPEEYEGGELEIETDFGVQTVKLGAGDMVLYPASSLHRVTPVTSGARIASFFWIESMVSDDSERAILFDLDQTIQQLTSRVGEHSAELLRLTRVYHNLLRRWAITV